METINLTAHIIQTVQIEEWAKAMNGFHKQVQPIAKDTKSAFSKYARLDTALDYIRPLLADNGLFLMQEITGDELTTTIFHTSGQFRSSTASMSVMWSSAGGANEIQKFGGSIAYYKRYTAFAMLSLSAQDDDDGNSHPKPEPQRRQQQQQQQPKKAAQPQRPVSTTVPNVSDASLIAFAKTKELLREINPSKELALLLLQGFFGVGESKEIPALSVAAINQGNNYLGTFQHEYGEYQLYCQQQKEDEDMEHIKELIESAMKIPF